MNTIHRLEYISHHLKVCAERSISEPNSLLIINLERAARGLNELIEHLKAKEEAGLGRAPGEAPLSE
jgi:hypothetical protein